MRRAKIVATIGPASESIEQLRRIIAAGVDVTRINMSHGDRMHHVEVVRRIREAAAAENRPVAVLADLCGPKIRTGRLAGGGPVRLETGASIRLVAGDIEGTAEAVSVSYAALGREVTAGNRILVDDGLIELRVTSARDGEVVAEVVNGGPLSERKGVNIPGVKLSIPSVTDKDIADLEAILAADVDYVALSFVREAGDCQHARALIDAAAAGVRLIAKIEKPEAVEAIESILDVVDGVMVARGDLGVETSPESVPIIQKRIITRAVERERMVITATQMLQSMIDNPRPTRAEASDVANAILDGTDAAMLSGETAVGKYPVETVATMNRIISYTEASRPEGDTSFAERIATLRSGSIGRAVAEAAIFAAREVAAKYLVVFSQSGRMAGHVAALRPVQRIVTFTPSLTVCRQLAGVWGVEPYVLDQPESADALLRLVDTKLTELGDVAPGEIVVTLVGTLIRQDLEQNPASHVLKMHRVGELG